MEASEFLGTVLAMHQEARTRGLFFQDTGDQEYEGRRIVIDGRSHLSFGSCSYLGLELDPRLIEGACDAARRYGTQFSTSRGYLSAPIYRELEASFDELFGAHTLLAPTTTLAHLSALDVLAHEKDAIVLDHQVHQSVQQAANLARTRGTHVAVVKHEDLERALDVVAELARKHRQVWFATDGVNSMYGDLAPFDLLQAILEVAPNVRLYVDDAHGMSWAGRHGRGSFLAHMALSPRVVLATSLAKAFGCGGGVLVFHDPAERDRVRMAGGTMLFSGPIQPPMLGAALASARIHLSPEIEGLQAALRARVRHTNESLEASGVRQLVVNDAPLFFLRLGLPKTSMEVAHRLLQEGIYVNVSMYPTVPMRRSGIRLSINANHSYDEIARVVAALARHIPEVLADQGVAEDELDALFARAVASRVRPRGTPSRPAPPPSRTRLRSAQQPELRVEHRRTIHDVDRGEWDRLVSTRGNQSWHSMAMLEEVHAHTDQPEHRWSFDYLIVRGARGEPIAAGSLTTGLQKDDFLMRPEISAACEERRASDPYFLTSRVVMLGSSFSEGRHLYVDDTHPGRGEALHAFLESVSRIYQRENADAVILRDLPADDPEMDALMLERGYSKAPMLASHVRSVQGLTDEALLASVGKNRRRALRKVIGATPSYEFELHGYHHPDAPLGPDDLARLHELYRNVAGRKLRINVFEMRAQMLEAMMRSPSWEIMTLRTRGAPHTRRPLVAWYAAHVSRGVYAPFVCGLDYEYVTEGNSAYRQVLLASVRRAAELNMESIHLGMDADFEKERLGTRAEANCVYVQARDHFGGALMRDIVAKVGAGAA